jgi:magnesium transporter
MNDTIDERLSVDELFEAWPALSLEERLDGFRMLPRDESESFLEQLSTRDQFELLEALPPRERRVWLRLLPPDDLADVLQEGSDEERADLLALLDDAARAEVAALLAYEEDAAGGLMNPRFVRLRPDMTVEEAISYLRIQMREHVEVVYYSYVLDTQQHLRGVVSFRQLVSAPPGARVRDVMRTDLVTVHEDMDQEAVSDVFAQHDLGAIPVLDGEGRMKGVVTVDDIVDVVKEEATEDIHKLAGIQTLDAPYLHVSLWQMVRKRVGWLAILFLGQMLTVSVMAGFEQELAQAAVLMLFIPLIISSGGNSGSQASTLVVRALALGEVRLRDWWRIVRREVLVGLSLGLLLCPIAFGRVLAWQWLFGSYGDHVVLLGLTVALAIVGVITWGTLAGSMLPIILRRLGFDPASASTPFVATLADVTGLLIYFAVATSVLRGTLL